MTLGFEFPKPKPPEPKPKRITVGTWDCIHPCAMLTMLVESGMLPLDEQLKNTLDCYGYISPNGQPNYEAARRECDRFKLY